MFYNLITYLSCNPGQIAQFSCWHTDKELSSESSHLGRVKVAQFVYQIISRVLREFADIIFTYTHYHTSYTQFYTKLFHLNYKITPFFALFFMLFHTRPLLRVYVFRQPVLLPAIPTDVASHDLYGNWGRKSNLLRSTYTFIHDSNFLHEKIKPSLFVT